MFSKLDLCRSNPTLDSLSIYTCHTPLAFASLQNHFEHRFCPCFGTSSNRELHWSINPIGGRVFPFFAAISVAQMVRLKRYPAVGR